MCKIAVMLLLSCAGIFAHAEPSKHESSVRVVRNGEKGLWEKGPGTVSKLGLVASLAIGDAEGDAPYLLGRVFDLAVDSRRSIYVLDNGYSEVRKYDAEGVFQGAIGRAGEGPGEFQFPLALTIDRYDNLYVADRSKVCVFDKGGKFSEEFRHGFPGGFPSSIRVGADESLFMACFDVFEQKVIHRYNSDRIRVASFCDSYAVGQSIDVRAEQTFSGGAIDIAPDGRIYFTQRHPYEVRVFSSDGDLLTQVYRDTKFMLEPIAIRDGDNMTVGLPTAAYSIVVLKNGYILNVLRKLDAPVTTMLDLFDDEGELLTSERFDRDINVRCMDVIGDLYSIEVGEFPTVVRYDLAYVNERTKP